MNGINYPAAIVLTLAAFIFSSVYYVATAKARAELSEAGKRDLENMKQRNPGKMLAEIVRTFVLVWVIAYLVEHTNTVSFGSGAKLGLLLWIGFPLILLSGSVMWEKVPAKLATIHAGDWFVKVFFVSAILAVWH
jgi:glycerol uptake facilitator-like aquaporin